MFYLNGGYKKQKLLQLLSVLWLIAKIIAGILVSHISFLVLLKQLGIKIPTIIGQKQYYQS